MHTTAIIGVIGFLIGFIAGNYLFLQHVLPIIFPLQLAPFVSDYNLDIIFIDFDKKIIEVSVKNKWDDQSSLGIEINSANNEIIDYDVTCQYGCVLYGHKIVSIEGHSEGKLNITFQTQNSTSKTFDLCIRAVSRDSERQFGEECENAI